VLLCHSLTHQDLSSKKHPPQQKVKIYCITGLDRPLGLQEVEAPRISRQSAHECGKVGSSTHRPSLPPGDSPVTHSCLRLSEHQAHSVAGRIKSMKNSTDPTGNQTRNFHACSTVLQPTVPSRTPTSTSVHLKMALSNKQKLTYGYTHFLPTVGAICIL
jgi:hypothetical protein